MREKLVSVKQYGNRFSVEFVNRYGGTTWFAELKNKQLAQRLCDMCNDVPAPLKSVETIDGFNQLDKYRITTTLKLFLMRENLSWRDLGMDDEGIRKANKILEEGLNGTDKTSSA